MNRILQVFLSGCLMIRCADAQVSLNVPAFEDSIRGSHVQVLDVRTPGEYASGYLPQAFLADWTQQDEFAKRVSALDKKQPVFVYCLSGVRSKAAAGYLAAQGFRSYNLAGGLNAWKQAGLPLAQQQAVAQMPLEDFNVMTRREGIVLVDFGATWCLPCKKMAPVIDSLLRVYPAVFFIPIDGGAQTALNTANGVNGFPTLIVYREGKEVWRHEGYLEPAEIAAHLH